MKDIVVIDAGHGGIDPGAMSPSGIHEADVNLSLAHAFLDASKVDGTFDVRLTREFDDTVELAERVRISNELGAKAFLSFHCNAFRSPCVRGFEVWTTPGVTAADELATRIFNALEFSLPYGGRKDLDDGDPDKEGSFYVLRRTTAPAVLIEFGFLTSPFDAAYLSDSGNRMFVGLVVELAVRNWIKGAP